MKNYIKRNKLIYEILHNLILCILLVYVVIRVIKLDIPTCITILCDNILRIIFILIFCIANVYISKKIMKFMLLDKNLIIKYLKKEVKNVLKELFKYLIFHIILYIVTSSYITGISQNTEVLNELFSSMYIFTLFYTIIIAPYLEEIIFRYGLYNIINNKYIYVIFTTFIFSAIHVLDDSNSLIYIWQYVPISFYLTYKYYKTRDLLTVIAIHSFHNLLILFI